MAKALKEFQVYGERNSGTNYLRKLMRENYQDILPLGGDRGFGWKHTDFGQPWCDYRNGPEEIYCHSVRDYKKDSKNVVFVVIYRNPITWLQSMHKHAHHAPLLYGLSFSDYIRHPWTSYYGIPGQESSPDKERRLSMVKPENLFEEYESVLDLRVQKNQIFESFKNRVDNVAYVNYEHLKDAPEEVLQTIADKYEFKIKGNFANITEDKFGFGKYKPKKYPPISKVDLDHIIDVLDWDQETSIGYRFDTTAYQKMNISQPMLAKLFRRPIEVESPNKLIKTKNQVRCYKQGKLLS